MTSALPLRRWDPAIHRGLCDLLAGPPGLACFDWDNTAVRGDIGLAALSALDRRDGTRHRERYEELDATQGALVSFPYCTEVWGGWRVDELDAYAAEVVAMALASGEVEARPEMRDLVEALGARGWDVRVVSASPRPFVVACAAAIGLSAPQVHAQELQVAGGVTLPKIAPPLFYREGKREVVDTQIGLRPLFAAGDSRSDYELLESAQHGLYIDHGDPWVVEAAVRKGWWLQRGWE